MITQTTKIFIVSIALVSATLLPNIAFAQVPPLESSTPGANESDKTTETTSAISIGKATIPVSSGEQIIIDIPLKDGGTYKLVPIK
jgi:hypothetical protein